MQVGYSLKTLETDNGSVVVEIKNNSQDKKLKIVVTISIYHHEADNGFRASIQFFEDDKTIEDLKSIVKNRKFLELVEYYHKAMIYVSSKEEEKEKLLDDNRFIIEHERTVTGTTFLGELARGIALKSNSKIPRLLDLSFLTALGSNPQAFSIFTTFNNSSHKEITIAKTHTGMGGYANKYASLTLFNRKPATELIYLHLANVTLANRQVLKQTNDIITGIEKVVSYIRRRALPYSLIIAAVQSAATTCTVTPVAGEFWSFFYPIILPLLWPAAAFLVRVYAPKIFPAIVRYAIKRILNRR